MINSNYFNNAGKSSDNIFDIGRGGMSAVNA